MYSPKPVDPERSRRATEAYYKRKARIEAEEKERRKGTIMEDGGPFHILLIIIVIGMFAFGMVTSFMSEQAKIAPYLPKHHTTR